MDNLSKAMTPFTLLKELVLLNPLATGSLVYLMTRGPDHIRETLLHGRYVEAITPYINIPGSSGSEALIKAIKVLFAVGVLAQVNRLLNRIAINKWALRAQGEKFNFKSGKEIICITGGSSGFGALMVKSFFEKTNATIVVMDIQPLPKDLESRKFESTNSNLDALTDSVRNVHFYKCDLAQPSQVREVTETIKAEVGNPTVLINNAGIGKAGLIIDATPEWIEKIFRVNVMSHWQTVAAFLPGMLKARKGHVVTVASMATFVGLANITEYCATKAGLLAFHEGLNQELKHRYENGRCIQTTIIHPNFAKTPLVTDGIAKSGVSTKHEGKLLAPELVTDKIVKQVLNGTSAQIFVPASGSSGTSLRGYATWFQELIRDGASKLTAAS